MSEWWTYRLSDFLLFSADAYYRLFELYNHSIWPAHLFWIAICGVVFFFLLRQKPWAGRVLFFLLGAGWIWVAWGYHLTHFATINWAATYYAAVFVLQGVLLLLVGGLGKNLQMPSPENMVHRIGLGLAGFGFLLQPLITPLFGRPWTQMELFGLTPDPTAIVTLGAVLLMDKSRRLLLPIPLLWCLISAVTLWTMHTA